MKPHVRLAAVAMAAAHSRGQTVSSVYDYSQSQHISISASVNGESITGYDYKNGCHIGGTLPSLYHYGVGKHLVLKPSVGGKYAGFDHDTGQHFEISVNGSSIDCYDYGENKNFSYSV